MCKFLQNNYYIIYYFIIINHIGQLSYEIYYSHDILKNFIFDRSQEDEQKELFLKKK